MTQRVDNTVFAFYELLIQAGRTHNKHSILLEADIELDKLRLYIRLCHDRHLANRDQHQFAAQ